jgi:hypothetical protein
MPKLFLTPFVIAGLLFLPSCSNSQEPKPSETPQAKSECSEVKETYDNFGKGISSQDNNLKARQLTSLVQNYYLLENTKCFTSVEIAFARATIDLINNLAN